MRELTLHCFKPHSGRYKNAGFTVADYQTDGGHLKKAYPVSDPAEAEKRFRQEFKLELQDIKVTVCGH